MRSAAAQTNENRWNALWGRGGRRASAAAAIMLCAFEAATAAAGAPGAAAAVQAPRLSAFVQPSLVSAIEQDPAQSFDVIVEGERRGRVANLLRRIDAETPEAFATKQIRREFHAFDGLQLTLTGTQILRLGRSRSVTAIVPNETVRRTSVELPQSNDQKWAWTTHAAVDWTEPALALNAPTIAVVDSGIAPSHGDFGDRLLGQVEIRSGSRPDGYGHGTFVAGIAAGGADNRAGVAPNANLLSVRVMDDDGLSTVADVVAACDWILANKATYDIGVVNMSLHATSPASLFFDPLDQAVERLWLNGVVVVTAAGNYAVDGAPSNVPFAPGNDPFVVTVGASDIKDTLTTSDDVAAPWSAWGYTLDGFRKPELSAPGRYLIGPSPGDSTLAAERPDHVVGHDVMQLSGTSFSAPAVSGAAALILARHPDWTPDQVKGALMVSAAPAPAAVPGSLGVGELDVAAARSVEAPPNPNAGLEQFVVTAADGSRMFDSASWQAAAQANAAWGDAAWGDAAWGDAAWGDAAWGDAAWSDASWASAAWGDAAWSDAAWGDAAWGDAAWADNGDDPVLPATPITSDERDAVLAELGIVDPACDPTAGSCTS